jgi:hypothetical protein
LWATPAWSDQLWLWWTLDMLARAGVDVARLRWASPRVERALDSAGAAGVASLQEALRQARPIGDDEAERMRRWWSLYAAESPLAFDEARRSDASLAAIAEPHGWWFPRLADGKLRLSLLDTAVLRSLDGEFRAPRFGAEIRERLLPPFGDSLLFTRLRQWSERGAAESRDGRFRLAAAGAQLLDGGLAGVGDAPEIFIGGCRVHDAARPFVRRGDDGDWRLASL